MTRISTICVMGSALALAAMSTSSASALVLNEHPTTPATNVLPNVTNNNKGTTQRGLGNLNSAGGSKIQNGSNQNLKQLPAVQQALPGTQ